MAEVILSDIDPELVEHLTKNVNHHVWVNQETGVETPIMDLPRSKRIEILGKLQKDEFPKTEVMFQDKWQYIMLQSLSGPLQ